MGCSCVRTIRIPFTGTHGGSVQRFLLGGLGMKSVRALYRKMMASIPFTAILVEEAAEIVEAHVVAALPATAQRLIMIGDHQQLRPKVNNYDLQVFQVSPAPLDHRVACNTLRQLLLSNDSSWLEFILHVTPCVGHKFRFIIRFYK